MAQIKQLYNTIMGSDEKGSLKYTYETVKYGHESHGTRTQK
jgi:hypothetical protein